MNAITLSHNFGGVTISCTKGGESRSQSDRCHCEKMEYLPEFRGTSVRLIDRFLLKLKAGISLPERLPLDSWLNLRYT
jgi:hypothetical protein